MNNFSHINSKGDANIVDISNKQKTKRIAIATGIVSLEKETLELVKNDKLKKGDVLATARIAGIMASKKTSDLIPLCHNINIEFVKVEFDLDDANNRIIVTSECHTTEKTGVEMEALLSCTMACLTIYDMIKSVDKKASITDIKLILKSGGKSGIFKRK
ncbi:MAG: cyclic pyranopterin monophosphate synthase MoaC [Rhodobiaceae bacterium]|nr:cyclic pyranopterin monophosphate synthase MoaC [Rhodobiaceae bacterium]RPF96233.1 MAG: cyclic pyranopterin monophosphate synthase MoaC [Rhizobiales bacterium TMED227]|tara:strand:- start:271 stop:747 length:477 start_codon:yes stop_codon:yes gene_type:complete